MTATHESVRRRRRNQLLLVGLLPSLVALLVAVALIVTLSRNVLGERATERGDHDLAQQRFAANRWVGAVEPWIAPYNEGVASLRAADHRAALADFLAALRTVPPEHECRVLHNIAVVRERSADAVVEDDDAAALDLYRRGREALAAGRCQERTDVTEQLVDAVIEVDDGLTDKIHELLERQEREALEELTPRERQRVEESEEDDERGQQREEQIRDEPPEPPEQPDEGETDEDPVEYGW